MPYRYGANRLDSPLIKKVIVVEPTLKQDWFDYEYRNRRSAKRYDRDTETIDDRYDRTNRGRYRRERDDG